MGSIKATDSTDDCPTGCVNCSADTGGINSTGIFRGSVVNFGFINRSAIGRLYYTAGWCKCGTVAAIHCTAQDTPMSLLGWILNESRRIYEFSETAAVTCPRLLPVL